MSSKLKSDDIRPGTTLATVCNQCNVGFKESDRITIKDGKAMHLDCAPEYDRIKNNKIYIERYPFLSESVIDKIIYTSINISEEFDKFDIYDWIILISLGSNEEEIIIQGFDTQEQVAQFIKTHYSNPDHEQFARIHSIYYQHQKYEHSVEMTVSLSPQ